MVHHVRRWCGGVERWEHRRVEHRGCDERATAGVYARVWRWGSHFVIMPKSQVWRFSEGGRNVAAASAESAESAARFERALVSFGL